MDRRALFCCASSGHRTWKVTLDFDEIDVELKSHQLQNVSEGVGVDEGLVDDSPELDDEPGDDERGYRQVFHVYIFRPASLRAWLFFLTSSK